MSHRVVFSPEAEAQLVNLYRYIGQQASQAIARRYTDAIVAHCEGLADFPDRGTSRGDIRRGLRTLAFRGRVTIAYSVHPTEVRILGIFYAGQDFEGLLREE